MPFLPQEIIRRKRDGHALGRDEINFLVNGLTDGNISDEQAAAFSMAVYFKSLSLEECVDLTLAMRDSGIVLDWSKHRLDGPVIDKHSTGGVGDLVSLVLGPLLAACGGYVPMISGRGLGHTGGTLDKLEAIPGYNTTPQNSLFQKVVSDIGVAIIGQTDLLAPADRRLYAIRDTTATVESIGLITASILSKKLALPYLTLPYLTLPYLTLPYLTLPYLTLPYLTLPCLALPCLALPCLALSYLTVPDLTLPYLTLPYPTLPYLTLPYLTLPYPTLPYPTLPYLPSVKCLTEADNILTTPVSVLTKRDKRSIKTLKLLT